MIALLQRVTEASVTIDGTVSAAIDKGLCVLIGVQHNDSESSSQKLVNKLLHFRVFPDEQGRMNIDIQESGGALLLVPQFTLAADTAHGRRPGFSSAAEPDMARSLFDDFCQRARVLMPELKTGTFGADMKVALINDGPVTFWLET